MIGFKFYEKHREAFNYLFFGFLTTLLTLITYYFLTMTILDANSGWQLQTANILSWIVGFLFAYITNRLFVFRSKNKNLYNEFFKFLSSRLFTLFLDMTIMFIFVTMLKFDNRIIKLVSQIIVILGNYILSKNVVFSNNKFDIKKISDYSLLIIIGIILFMGISTVFLYPKSISLVENRSLEKISLPTFRSFLKGDYQNTLEQALADQFPLSRKIKLYSNLYLYKIDINNINSQICKGRYVYLNENSATYDCHHELVSLPTSYSDEIINKHFKFYNEINQKSDAYYYIIDRNYVYDFENNKLVIDSYNILKDGLKGKYKLKKLEVNDYETYQKYFYKSDHHWNLYGSYQGYKDIIKMIYPKDKIKKPLGIKECSKNKFVGSIAKSSKQLSINDEFKYYQFNLKDHKQMVNGVFDSYSNYDNCDTILPYSNVYGEIYGLDYREIVFDFKDDSKENLLIIASSYSNPINELIASHFNKTYVVDFRYYKNFDLDEYLDTYDIDKVLVLVSTDVLIGKEFIVEEGK